MMRNVMCHHTAQIWIFHHCNAVVQYDQLEVITYSAAASACEKGHRWAEAGKTPASMIRLIAECGIEGGIEGLGTKRIAFMIIHARARPWILVHASLGDSKYATML